MGVKGDRTPTGLFQGSDIPVAHRWDRGKSARATPIHLDDVRLPPLVRKGRPGRRGYSISKRCPKLDRDRPCRSAGLIKSALEQESVHQSLLGDPIVDQLRDVVGIAIHHQHVGVAFDAHEPEDRSTSALPPAATRASRYLVGAMGRRCQTATLSRKSPHTMRCGTPLSLPTSTLAGSGAPEGSIATSALILSGAVKRGVESEAAALAVHHHDAGTDFFHQRVVGLLRRRVVGHPARDPLHGELVERLDRKLLAFERDTRSADFVARPDAKQLPGFLLGAEHRLGFEDFGIARPRGAPALDRVRDIDVITGVEEKLLPAGLAVGFGLPRDAGEAAAVPQTGSGLLLSAAQA